MSIFLWRKHLPEKCHWRHACFWRSIDSMCNCLKLWGCVFWARFFANFRWRRFSKVTWPAKASPGLFKFSYLRKYCIYFLYICLTCIKRMKIPLSENKMRFKVIPKMRAQLGMSTTFLTVLRISKKVVKLTLLFCLTRKSAVGHFVYCVNSCSHYFAKQILWHLRNVYTFCCKTKLCTSFYLFSYRFIKMVWNDVR